MRRESESSNSVYGQRRLSVDTLSLSQADNQRALGAMGPPETDAGHQDRRQSVTDNYQAPALSLQAVLRRTVLPSPEVAILLFEIYFSRLYNASLLFHKKSLLSDYAANRVPDFVALSVFALASMYVYTLGCKMFVKLDIFQILASVSGTAAPG